MDTGSYNLIKLGVYGNDRSIYTGTNKYLALKYHYRPKEDPGVTKERLEKFKKEHSIEEEPDIENEDFYNYNALCLIS